MNELSARDRRILEIMLIGLTVGMTILLYQTGAYRMVVLNLFYLPICLSGYYLGRTSAGVLALFSVLAVTIMVTFDGTGFAAFRTPVVIGLALSVWAASLGLAAILVGTLCDEGVRTVEDLHRAYVGVVEVLSRYLQSANPAVKARSIRVAQLSQAVAEEMKLSRKQIDDVRVGALLYDLGNVEITTQLLNRAVGTLEAKAATGSRYTFSGLDLVHSLGSVLRGAMPLLLAQDEAVRACLDDEQDSTSEDVPVGARIIRAVRAYDALVEDDAERPQAPQDALRELRKEAFSGYDTEVLDGLERTVGRNGALAAGPKRRAQEEAFAAETI